MQTDILIVFQVTPTVGELVRPVSMTENMFVSEQKSLRGMNETLISFQVLSSFISC